MWFSITGLWQASCYINSCGSLQHQGTRSTGAWPGLCWRTTLATRTLWYHSLVKKKLRGHVCWLRTSRSPLAAPLLTWSRTPPESASPRFLWKKRYAMQLFMCFCCFYVICFEFRLLVRHSINLVLRLFILSFPLQQHYKTWHYGRTVLIGEGKMNSSRSLIERIIPETLHFLESFASRIFFSSRLLTILNVSFLYLLPISSLFLHFTMNTCSSWPYLACHKVRT